jgi:ribosome-associated toxin RatA of RatAB toxin-antitoxin module
LWPRGPRPRIVDSARIAAVIAIASFTLLLAATITAPRVAHAQKELSGAERASLNRGQLVMRPMERRHGDLKLVGGVAWQVIDLPSESVWKAVTDYGNYRRFIPVAIESLVTHKDAKGSTVRMRHARGPIDMEYSLHLSVKESTKTASFKVDKARKHDIREGWGYFAVEPFGPTKSLVTFGIFADVGDGIFAGLVRPKVQDWMLRVPAELRKFVHGSGRRLYTK